MHITSFVDIGILVSIYKRTFGVLFEMVIIVFFVHFDYFCFDYDNDNCYNYDNDYVDVVDSRHLINWFCRNKSELKNINT